LYEDQQGLPMTVQTIHSIETPAVVIDLDRVEANLRRAQDHADAHGLALRPHIKTHKMPRFAQRQVALGAVGITCQKLGEAEVMADAGLGDILLPYNIIGAAKLQRLAALAGRTRLSVTADSLVTIEGYAATFAASGLPARVVSSGGTPDLWRAPTCEAITEYRPGTYIYLDRYQVAQGVGTLADCALTVMATVVSRPTADRAIIDAGSKTLTSDTLGLAGFGLVLDVPDAEITGLSEEHGTVDLSRCAVRPAIGDRVRILPNHACVVANLFDRVHLASGERVVEVADIAARGRVT
jgi:D-serine deaminase-like pyridoxal phosphate-dependent protein